MGVRAFGGNRRWESGGASISRARIAVPQQQIEAFCRRHGIKRLSLLGSVLRDDFLPGSDVDVLVEFAPGSAPGLAFFEMQEELSAILGRKVDLNTPGFLSPYFREEVLKSAEERYVAS
ncbi:MAG: nucleotidyltransferase family protein [Terracidiphilus sp.]